MAYGSDVALVQRVLLEAVQGNPGVLRHPGPSVFFVDFGDSSLDFEIRAFVGAFDQRLRVRHELLLAVDAVPREHGIEIPFPQRDFHIRSGRAEAERPAREARISLACVIVRQCPRAEPAGFADSPSPPPPLSRSPASSRCSRSSSMATACGTRSSGGSRRSQGARSATTR